MIHILSFCTNPEILPVMDRLVNKHSDDWTGYRAPDLATARRVLAERRIDCVLLGAGTGREEQEALLADLAPDAHMPVFIHHYGGGSGLLYAEVEQALAGR